MESEELSAHQRSATKGRPTADTPIPAIEWQRQGRVRPDAERRREAKQHNACGILGPNVEPEQLSDAKVIAVYGLAVSETSEVIVVGRARQDRSYGIAVARLGADGTLDEDFGQAGRATIQIDDARSDAAYDVAVQADGKIVVAGRSGNNGQIVLVRLAR